MQGLTAGAVLVVLAYVVGLAHLPWSILAALVAYWVTFGRSHLVYDDAVRTDVLRLEARRERVRPVR